jgi:bacterioferritin-associated ferredoxin
MYVCLCKGITEQDVKEAGRAGLVMPCQLKVRFGLKDSGCCGRCSKNIQEFVELATSQHSFPASDSLRTRLAPH